MLPWAEGVAESVTVTTTSYVPAAVGVPLITGTRTHPDEHPPIRSEDTWRPGGREEPAAAAQVKLYGCVPPAKEIIAFTPTQVRWFTPSYYTDGRERAQLLGDSSQGDHVSIVRRSPPANVSMRIRIRRMKRSPSSKEPGIWVKERSSIQQS